jgi:hypothetical protein
VTQEEGRPVSDRPTNMSSDSVSGSGDNAKPDPSDRFVSGRHFILDASKDVPALWGDGDEVLWPEGESLMIAGPMGVGKTTLAGQLMRAQLGLGDGHVLGLPVKPRDGLILYLAMDRPRQIARAFARQFSNTREDRHALAHVKFWPGPPPADIARYPTLLVGLAEALDGVSTVYVDSIKDAAIGLSGDAVGAGYNRARQHLIASGRQLCELHHTIKRNPSGGAPKDAADVYGSTWITAGTGSVIMLSGDPGDPIVGFRHVRQPVGEVGPYQLLHNQATGEMTIHHQADLVELARAGEANGITARQAAVALFSEEKPTQAQVEKARRQLDKRAEAGLLKRVDGAKGGDGVAPSAWFPNEAVVVP